MIFHITAKRDSEQPSLFYVDVTNGERAIAGLLVALEYDIHPIYGFCAMVMGVKVDADYQRQGVATLMMMRAEEECRSHTCGVMRLMVDIKNTPAVNLYQKLGFVVHDDVPRLNIMEKVLS